MTEPQSRKKTRPISQGSNRWESLSRNWWRVSKLRRLFHRTGEKDAHPKSEEFEGKEGGSRW